MSGEPSGDTQTSEQSIVRNIRSSNELTKQQIAAIAARVPGGKGNVGNIYPLSSLQEGMLLDRLVSDRDPYVLSIMFELQSRLNVEQLHDAVQWVIDRHDSLRTAVLWEGIPHPLQVVYLTAKLNAEEIELDVSRACEAQVYELMRPECCRIEITQAPLVRLQLLGDPGSEKWFAILRVHHIVCDHQSLQIVIDELMARLRGTESQLPMPATLGSIVAQTITAIAPSDPEVFFRSKLGDFETPSAPFERVDIRGDAGSIKEAKLSLDQSAALQLQAKLKACGVSVARLFHAAWAIVVARTSGRDDVVFGTVLSIAKHESDTGRALGLAVNTLPLRVRLQGLDARALISVVDREIQELRHFRNTPLALAQCCSGVAGTTPLFTTLFNYRRSPYRSELESDNKLDVIVRARSEASTNYPISMIVDDWGKGFTFLVQTEQTVEPTRVLNYFNRAVHALVQALEEAPQTAALSIPILPRLEQRQLLEVFNATQVPYPHTGTVHGLFEAQVERTPDSLAVQDEYEALTYAELNARANRLARYLRSRGVGAEDLVAICIERNVELVVGLLAIMKSGAAYVPLDPSYPFERLDYMIEDAAPRVLLAGPSLRAGLHTGATEVLALDEHSAAIAAENADNLHTGDAPRQQQLAYVIYTSGSTGKPKGVMVEQRAVVNFLLSMQRAPGVGASDCLLAVTTISFDIAALELYLPLIVGAKVVIASRADAVDAPRLVSLMERFEVTVLQATPATWQLLVGSQWAGRSSLKAICGGEALKTELSAQLVQRVGSLWNLYGPTETTIWSCVRSIVEAAQHVPAEPIGGPIANTQVYILDSSREPVPIGVAGEIHIGGAGVARGYHNRADLTVERFITDPFQPGPGTRMYKTGDLGRWRADGTIEYLGRNDHQVKIRGFRIELGEIESRLVRHERVKEAVVLAREDVPGERRLVAYVVAREQTQQPSVEAVRAHVMEALPEYMVPNAFVMLERMPLTPNGKLDRRALPAPELGAYISREYEAPQGEVEEILAGIWQSLLRVERVGRQDNFFELGGHSLLIVQMMERLRRVGLSTQLRQVFDSSSLAELASALGSGANEQYETPPNLIPDECEAITPEMLLLVELDARHIERIVQVVPGGAANVQDIYPLAPLQEGILFHHLLNEQGGDIYVLPLVLELSSRQRVTKLIAALQATIDRHDVLRTAVLYEELPRPVQVVCRRAVLPVKEVELQADRSAEEQIHDWIRPERQRLDLRQAPLLRLQVAEDQATGQWYALLQLHHMVIDHVTLEIITAEVLSLLQGHAPLQSESIPYRNHVARALAYARTPDAETFFRSRLGSVDESTAPFGLADVHGDGSHIEEAREEIHNELAQRVRAQAKRFGVGAATLFHAAWSLVVAHTSGRDDVVFGSVLLGRLHGAQHALGMFINTLPLRLQLQSLSTQQLVELTQRELVELISHDQASLAAAQRCSRIAGSVSLFTALLNYRHGAPSTQAKWSSAEGVRMLLSQERTNYPVTVSVDDTASGFALIAQTDRRIEPRRVTGYLHAAVRSIVEALEQSIQTPALELSILQEGERRQLIEVFNTTQHSYRRERMIHELIEEQVERTPHEVAVISGGEHLTYRELNCRANQLARHLRDVGVEADTLVGVCVERSVEMVVGLLGIWKAGGAYVPLDPSYPAERLEYMLADASPLVLLTQAKLRARLPKSSAEVLALDSDWRKMVDKATDNLDSSGLLSHRLAYVIYTSGSTGRPKGAMIDHANVLNLHHGLDQFYHRAGVYAHVALNASFTFDASVQQFAQLIAGRTLHLVPSEVRRDPTLLLDFLKDHRIEAIDCTPSQLRSWVAAGLLESNRHLLRLVLVGGEPIDIELWNRLAACTHIDFYNVYGPTECTVDTTAAQIRGDTTAPHIGQPMANRKVYVLGVGLQPAPLGVVGEIYIGGDGVGRGYLNRPELTAERFIPDPFSADPQARIYRTGDLGRWRADGSIEYLGRNDHQVKIRGFRIELGEIEAQLTRHEQVKEAVVLAREDVSSEKRLVAYVVAHEQTRQAEVVESLRTHAKEALPEYMVPSAFVMLDRMPLMPNGKLDRRALPAPELGAYISRKYEAPQGEVEEVLAEIWQSLLQVERVGRRDDFFDLGGHSLLVMKAIARVGSQWSIEVSIRSLFDRPTLSEFAAHIDDRRSSLLLERIAEGGEEMEELLQTLTSMPESRARELLQLSAMEGKS